MLNSPIILPGSLDSGPPVSECNKCGKTRPDKDGVYMGSKFVCGTCWRLKAIVRANASTRSTK